ncbi:MarP family serine protease [Nigerium massiliense]|uniref:MarP family serine protease n=1 Tax=Nigerium massiliense TaxID=1522317 RepID=UPI000693CBF7|nr:MarP family serine protease [Nigerium massiliense]
MTMLPVLDIVLVVILLLYVARGFRRGLVAIATSLIGLILGVGLALWLAPLVLARFPAVEGDTMLRTVLLLAAILLCGALGEGLIGSLGRRLRSATDRVGPLRFIDATLGAVAGGVVAALVMWVVALAAQPIIPSTWARQLDRSRVLTTIDRSMPDQAGRVMSSLTDALDSSGFPEVFSGLGKEPSIAAPEPDSGAAQTAGVRRAAASIVRVDAQAPRCFRSQEGSGWVSATNRVVTNAHVVAGSDTVEVRVGGTGAPHRARVVSFDPQLDIAVLSVPGLDARPLQRSGALSARSSGVVAGFPQGGPYTVDAARVRGTIAATGADIYGEQGVRREIYALRTTVQPGNSGGPLLTPDGRVAGTVFARSTTDPSTGYALTNAATAAVIDAGARDTTPAGTGACSAG